MNSKFLFAILVLVSLAVPSHGREFQLTETLPSGEEHHCVIRLIHGGIQNKASIVLERHVNEHLREGRGAQLEESLDYYLGKIKLVEEQSRKGGVLRDMPAFQEETKLRISAFLNYRNPDRKSFVFYLEKEIPLLISGDSVDKQHASAEGTELISLVLRTCAKKGS